MKKTTYLTLVLILIALLIASFIYPYWYSNQLWIGFESYAASTNGIFGVSPGYSIYAVSPAVPVACFIALAVLFFKRPK